MASHFLPRQTIFRGLGSVLYTKQTTRNPTQPKNSRNTLYWQRHNHGHQAGTGLQRITPTSTCCRVLEYAPNVFGCFSTALKKKLIILRLLCADLIYAIVACRGCRTQYMAKDNRCPSRIPPLSRRTPGAVIRARIVLPPPFKGFNESVIFVVGYKMTNKRLDEGYQTEGYSLPTNKI